MSNQNMNTYTAVIQEISGNSERLPDFRKKSFGFIFF